MLRIVLLLIRRTAQAWERSEFLRDEVRGQSRRLMLAQFGSIHGQKATTANRSKNLGSTPIPDPYPISRVTIRLQRDLVVTL